MRARCWVAEDASGIITTAAEGACAGVVGGGYLGMEASLFAIAPSPPRTPLGHLREYPPYEASEYVGKEAAKGGEPLHVHACCENQLARHVLGPC